MLYVLFALFSSVLVSVYGICQNVDGQKVSWWILFQQKERPYFHNYIDSTNSQKIKEHYPERNDSVLSRAVASVTHNNDAEYVIYSIDLINVKDIAAKFSIPTYSKWMHGILGTVSSWESGFWILHNNLLFPALTNGALAVPGSKAWYATTVGDSNADVFYICLTAENKGNMTEMLKSIMAGNPFIYKRRFKNYDFLQPYLKEVRALHTSFGYEMSAEIFLKCMHASSKNVTTNCLFTYAVTTGVAINIFTRPRGMIKHSSEFCYDDQSISSFDFLKLEKRSPLQSGFSHSMFAISDKTDSSVTGMMCFGQDIAANVETIAVMICAHLPTVYVDAIKSTRLTQWSCQKKNSRTDIAGIYNKGQTNHRTDTLRSIKPQISSESPTGKPANKNANEQLHDATDDSDEKDVAKFCQMYDCDNYNSEVELEESNINSFNSQLLKNQKMIDRFTEMVADIQMQHNLNNPRKTSKKNKQNKNVIMVKRSSDVNQFFIDNKKAVLGLFCQEGCRYCQNAREQLILLAKHLQTDNLDFVIVDINEASLPDYLQVPFTPYIRYKFHGLSKWIDYSEEIFDIEHVLLFLHRANTEET